METSKQFREFAEECNRLAEAVGSEAQRLTLKKKSPQRGDALLRTTTDGILNRRDHQPRLCENARFGFRHLAPGAPRPAPCDAVLLGRVARS
jgi:hypothetical protein